MDSGVGGWCLINPSFSRIFFDFLTWQDPIVHGYFVCQNIDM